MVLGCEVGFTDVKMPFLVEALDLGRAQQVLSGVLGNRFGGVRVCRIDLIRHKLGRRCAIAYDLEVGNEGKNIKVIGKCRAKGLDKRSYEVQRALWEGSFDYGAGDGICVPEPLGIVPEWAMWLQERVPGVEARDLLAGENGVILAEKMAVVACKIHQAGVSTSRHHGIADEMAILRDRLGRVSASYPHWQHRLDDLLNKCEMVANSIPEIQPCGIHRDFYADQVIVDGDRGYPIDFDLYCWGNPALDIGNFIAHITEYSLRVLGNAGALRDREMAMLERFVALRGEEMRPAVEGYAILTLVRHIYISTQISDRRPFTESLLELCQQRLMK